MKRNRRPSAQTIAVLRALAAEPARWRYGYDLCTVLDMRAGSMYPILMRLAGRGLLETGWETERVAGRPPRHLYRLSGAGIEYASAIPPSAERAASQPGRGAGPATSPAGHGVGPAGTARKSRPQLGGA